PGGLVLVAEVVDLEHSPRLRRRVLPLGFTGQIAALEQAERACGGPVDAVQRKVLARLSGGLRRLAEGAQRFRERAVIGHGRLVGTLEASLDGAAPAAHRD